MNGVIRRILGCFLQPRMALSDDSGGGAIVSQSIAKNDGTPVGDAGTAQSTVPRQRAPGGGVDRGPQIAHERAGPQPDKSDGVSHDPFAGSGEIDWGSAS